MRTMLYCTTEIFKEVLNTEHYLKREEISNEHFKLSHCCFKSEKNPLKEGRSRMMSNFYYAVFQKSEDGTNILFSLSKLLIHFLNSKIRLNYYIGIMVAAFCY
jgi:TfoX/Sxy family transcriptional regulator of competence genes